MTNENRQHPRYAIDVDCAIVARGATMHARTRNLSRTGISCMVQEPMAPLTEVQLELALSFGADTYSEPIKLPATIVWCTQMGDRWQLGARFGELAPPIARALGVFIRFLEGID